MIEVIEGRGVGAGKSYFALERAMAQWSIGGTTCISATVAIKWEECKKYAAKYFGIELQDQQYRIIKDEDLQRLHEVTPAGEPDCPVLLIVDEAQDAFNSRDWSDKRKRPFFSWLCQSRHDSNDVVILSQAAANVDKQVRRLATFIWVVRNSEYFPILGISMRNWVRLFTFGVSSGRFFIRTQLDQDGHSRLDRKWIFADTALFRCYESLSMRLKHRRESVEAVKKLKLSKVKRTKSMKGLILISLVVTIFAGCTMYKFVSGYTKKKTPVAVATSAPAESTTPKKGEPQYHNGQVIAEAMRGYYFKGYLQTSARTYCLGKRNDLGMVTSVSPNRVTVEINKAITVFIEPYQDNFHVEDKETSSQPYNPMLAVTGAKK